MKKKLFTILCALFAVQMATWAQETSGFCGNPDVNGGHDVKWELEISELGDSTIVISGVGEMANFEALEERPWNSFANTIKYLIIEDGVTSIGDFSFAYCEGLVVVYGGDINYIGEGAFCLCRNLLRFDMISNARYIGDCAFIGCHSLKGNDESEYGGGKSILYLTASFIGRGAFEACPNIDTVVLLGEYVSEIAFRGCTGLKTLVVGKNVESISTKAFFECENLVTVECMADTPPSLGENVFEGIHPDAQLVFENENFEVIYAYASSDWAKYFTITTPPIASGFCGDRDVNGGEDVKWDLSVDGVLTISGVGAMENYGQYKAPWLDDNYSIVKVVVEEGVTTIGNNAFVACLSLTSVTLPGTLDRIGDEVFRECIALESIAIPEGVTSIGDGAFVACLSLTSVTLPGTLDRIGNQVFMVCTALESIAIPEGVTSIGDGAFVECQSLTSVTLPGTLDRIGNDVFMGCFALESIAIPEGVTSIGDAAFVECRKLSAVTCLNPIPPTLGGDTFWGISSTAILRVPNVETYKASDWYQYFQTIVSLNTDTGGICDVEAENATSTTIYDLSGRRVEEPVKGCIYIVGGKVMVW